MKTLLDIHHGGKIYRPFSRDMVKGWDKTKSGAMRPYGMVDGRETYLFPEGFVVYDAETGRSIDSVKRLPFEIQQEQKP